jgi:hypothetical protein
MHLFFFYFFFFVVVGARASGSPPLRSAMGIGGRSPSHRRHPDDFRPYAVSLSSTHTKRFSE